ncbi:MAG: A/G-specific adenine glycosylase [Solobacterium sp.]|nr:A/G-specific adenine glycosylase [Solobacterium sp.]
MSTHQLNRKDMNQLVSWYKKNKRVLPWRDTGNSYDVWISEIMLQQTRVEAVIPYFLRFKETLPTIEDLSHVSEDSLMRLWEGLGYYSRARNLKKSAEILVKEFQGKLPEDYDTLLHLPGIGPYTAGAICSIAFHQQVPAVDGNVLRVLSRYLGIKEDIKNPTVRKQFEDIIQSFYQVHKPYVLKHPDYPSSFTQSLMELGALLCLANTEPHCSQCPLCNHCYAYKHHVTSTIPYRSSLKDRKIINRTIFIIRCGNQFLLHKRPKAGLLANLYEFIGVNQYLQKKKSITYVQSLGFEPLHISLLPSSKHIFSHQEWHMKAYEVEVSDFHETLDSSYRLVTKKELQSLAIPSAFKTYIDYYSLRD